MEYKHFLDNYNNWPESNYTSNVRIIAHDKSFYRG